MGVDSGEHESLDKSLLFEAARSESESPKIQMAKFTESNDDVIETRTVDSIAARARIRRAGRPRGGQTHRPSRRHHPSIGKARL